MKSPCLLWFRQDLRLRDNEALRAAAERGGGIVPVFICDEGVEGLGQASRSWLHRSLAALDESLGQRGSRLTIARGPAWPTLQRLRQETGAEAVYWNRCYEPAAIARDTRVKEALRAEGSEAKSFNSSLLYEPPTIANKQGRPFQVFTPFWRYCQTRPVPEEVPSVAKHLPGPAKWPKTLSIDALGLRPAVPWDSGFYEVWEPGEAGARRRLKKLLANKAEAYAERRDFPGDDATSRLSPHLHFGEIGPRQIWAAAHALSRESGVYPANRGVQKFLQELGWREFAYHLLYHFPHTVDQPLRDEFKAFPWETQGAEEKLRLWEEGRTGYPIVDAGMRQLWRTGWMHNRVRMVTGSFLVKHLRLPWTKGAAWFHDTLVDADLANNTLGWQWTAGSGADAAPYFRIFSPVLQGEKFDAHGRYVRAWLPELAKLPDRFLHRPWEAPGEVLALAGVQLGVNYPRPMVDHATARTAALAAYEGMKDS